MTTIELCNYFEKLLNIKEFDNIDISQNGLQVENSNQTVNKVVFAVDACLETILKAKELNANMLFVHHGLFWGKSLKITDIHYKRIKELIHADIALYAAHLPLDAHPLYGNNVGLANRIDLINQKPFGFWHNKEIGIQGEIPETNLPVCTEQLAKKLFPAGENPLHILPFGTKNIKTVGIISGAASRDLAQAIELNLDAYITGELKHEAYHLALENKINVIAGGHYHTETIGVQLVAEKLNQDTGIETAFIELPTGL